jgi:hypothetical protein
MAGQAASEIRVGTSGTIYIAPSGTAGPVDILAAWTGFTNIGYATEDGVKLSRGMDTEQIKAWQSISTLRYLITGVTLTAAFTLIQNDKDIIPLYFGGGSITTQAAGKYLYNITSAPTIDERVFGVEWVDGSLIYRFVMGRCMVTETGETTVGRNDAIQWPFTLSAMTPTSGTVLGYLLTNDTAAFA